MNPHTADLLLSAYGNASRMPSPVNRMMSAFAADFREGVDINLGVGYVNENTIPRERIREALAAVLANPSRYKSPLNYGGPQGLADAHRIHPPAITSRTGSAASPPADLDRPDHHRAQRRHEPPGRPRARLRPGIVITSDPMYYIYCDFLERRGFTVVTVPERMDGLHADDVRGAHRALGRMRRSGSASCTSSR